MKTRTIDMELNTAQNILERIKQLALEVRKEYVSKRLTFFQLLGDNVQKFNDNLLLTSSRNAYHNFEDS